MGAAARVRAADPRSRLQPDPRSRRRPFAQRGSAPHASPAPIRLGSHAREGAAPPRGGDRDGSGRGGEPGPLPDSTAAPSPACLRFPAGTRKDAADHSDTRMTERYTLRHVPEAMRLAAARLKEHLGVPDAPTARRKRAATGARKLGHWSKLAGYLLASAAHSRRDGVPAAMRPDLLVPNTRYAGIAVYRVASTNLKTLYRSLSLASELAAAASRCKSGVTRPVFGLRMPQVRILSGAPFSLPYRSLESPKIA